jgi:uncharacterized membrane protein YhaH (DUF805 family)
MCMPECHRRAVRDRGKNAWWLLVFYAVPGVLGHSAKGTWVAGAAGMGLHYILALAGFALSIWEFIEIGCLSGNAGSNRYGSNPFHYVLLEAVYSAAKAVAQLKP